MGVCEVGTNGLKTIGVSDPSLQIYLFVWFDFWKHFNTQSLKNKLIVKEEG